MKTILSWARRHYRGTVSLFLIMVIMATLIVGMVGCANRPAIDAIEIRDWYDLQAISDNMTADYILMNDLDTATDGWEELASPTANGGKGWEPITGIVGQPYWFTGVFDGQGHEIRDLFINRPDENHVGLFPLLSMAGVIRNVGVVDADVTGGGRVGGLVGEVNFSYVSNSYCTGTVTGNDLVGGVTGCMFNNSVMSNSYSTGSVSGNTSIGGLVGYIDKSTVSDSYSTGTVTGNEGIGGLVGDNDDGTVSNSYSTGTVTGNKEIGGLVGYNGDGTVSDCYSTGSVTGDNFVGGLVGQNWYGVVSNSFWDRQTSGQYSSDGGTGKTTAEMKDITTFTDTGTEGLDEPWDIVAVAYEESNPACIWNVVDAVTYPFLSWGAPPEVHEVRDWNDLHGIRDNLRGIYILMNDLDSATAGYEELASPTADDGMGWEPIGELDETFLNGFNGILDGQGYEIRELFVNRPEGEGVGLFGFVREGTVRDTGLAETTMTGCGAVGSLVGDNWGTVSGSYSTGSVTGNNYTGGLVGYNGGTVADSYYSGSVAGDAYVGGLVGDNWGTVSGSYSTGSVAGNNYTGGLVGYNGGTVADSYSTAGVSGVVNAGGLVGDNWRGTVSNSYATGSVIGSSCVGGLVGQSWQAVVSNSYSTGSVSGESAVGGLVGWNSVGTVSDSYSSGSVTGSEYVGGLVGSNTGTVSDSFWDTETSGQATSDGGTGKTTTEMQDITTFSDATWDVVAVANPSIRNTGYVWNIVDAETYPFLSWQPVS